MAENSTIEWTDHTFNPWIGCTKVSPACQFCYAERDMDHRFGRTIWGATGTRSKTAVSNWQSCFRWNRAAHRAGRRDRVFCLSLGDVFEGWEGPILNSANQVLMHATVQTASPVSRPLTMDDLRNDLFEIIDETPCLDWLLLTKRPENIRQMWPAKADGAIHRSNVWLGVSTEDQEWADRRLPFLHDAKRAGLVDTTFVSAEPLLGPVMLHGQSHGKTFRHLGGEGIDWVIAGGESGPSARPSSVDWFRSLRDQCREAGVPFFFKQWGEHNEHQQRVGRRQAGRLLDGVLHNAVPQQTSS